MAAESIPVDVFNLEFVMVCYLRFCIIAFLTCNLTILSAQGQGIITMEDIESELIRYVWLPCAKSYIFLLNRLDPPFEESDIPNHDKDILLEEMTILLIEERTQILVNHYEELKEEYYFYYLEYPEFTLSDRMKSWNMLRRECKEKHKSLAESEMREFLGSGD